MLKHTIERQWIAGLALASGFIATQPVQGQTLPDAGALMRQTEQSLRSQRIQPSRDLLAPPLVLDASAHITARQFKFAGVSRLKPEVLEQATQGFANQALTPNDLDRLCATVVHTYRDAGWVIQAYVPKQSLPTEVLTIQVIETLQPARP
jgi:hemolysin activation/secretion protein